MDDRIRLSASAPPFDYRPVQREIPQFLQRKDALRHPRRMRQHRLEALVERLPFPYSRFSSSSVFARYRSPRPFMSSSVLVKASMSPHRIASRPSCTRKSDAPILLPSVRRSSAATHGPIHAPAPLAFSPLPHVFIPCPLSLACQTALLGVWLYIQHTVLTSRPTPCGGNRPNDHRLPRRAGAVVRRRGCGRARRRRGGLGDPTDSSAAIRARTDHRIPDCGDPMAAEMVYGARRGPGRRRGGTGVARRRVAAARVLVTPSSAIATPTSIPQTARHTGRAKPRPWNAPRRPAGTAGSPAER